ncbi:DeoR/GlpR family DNA-binding transcription regulator [Lactococcus cremoris]|uniref:DeoR/GlpR family DNA-binding transcription regulator n=1 Tax=Lactococcus lactis subsp. cremoris TaxID=1359 RepID=UPI0019642672|nr:DeoR/GlpR family DNA-binding transcription regulator [Lactococcus cremoris]QRZ29759.1 lactose transport regulator [Lactococcus cremoris]
MLANERKKRIVYYLKINRRATIEELLTLMYCSISTLRRDLNELEKEKSLRRVHGGAELTQDLSEELSISEKTSKNIQEKEEIAQIALSKIKDGDIVFLDAGTTTGLLAELINQSHLYLTIVTNSVTHLAKLTDGRLIVYLLGGRVKKVTDAIIGSQALEQLSAYQFNVAFVGANGFDTKHGAMTPDHEEAAIKGLAVKQSQNAYVLADSSKLGQMSFVKFANSEEVELITENN